MKNHIREVYLLDARLSPADAEVLVLVSPERLTSTTQVRGRLTGPRCPYTTTVEVAYPLREHSRQYESEGPPRITLRVIIPEPSFWDPQTPFLYGGPLELWQDGVLCEQRQVKHGLRVTRMGPRALSMNGKPLKVCGVRRSKLSDEQAEYLHGKGHNTLLTSAAEDEGLWDMADRWGYVVIHALAGREDLKLAAALKDHPCCLAWLVMEGPQRDDLLLAARALADPARGQYVGVELNAPLERPLPAEVSFVAFKAENLAMVEQVPLPKVALVPKRAEDAPEPTFAEDTAVLGWISE